MKKLSLFVLMFIYAMTTTGQNQKKVSIQYEDVYTVYITKDLNASRDFYVQWLDFEIVFEASWFVYMQSNGEHKLSLALIDEKHPSTPPAYGAFNGSGSFLTLQVADATAVYNQLKAKNAPISYTLTKEDWGQLRFGLTDPNGLYVDIVQQIEPKEGYWEHYMK